MLHQIGKKSFTYHWKHLATGIEETREIYEYSRMNFLEKLNKWNRIGNGRWLYYEVPSV